MQPCVEAASREANSKSHLQQGRNPLAQHVVNAWRLLSWEGAEADSLTGSIKGLDLFMEDRPTDSYSTEHSGM